MEITYYGEIDSERGLAPVAEALAPCSWAVELVTSGFDGTRYLRACSELIDLDMDSGQRSPYVFSGGIEGGLDEARALLAEFSGLLARAGVRHRLEAYDETAGGGAPAVYLHHDWPRPAPAAQRNRKA